MYLNKANFSTDKIFFITLSTISRIFALNVIYSRKEQQANTMDKIVWDSQGLSLQINCNCTCTSPLHLNRNSPDYLFFIRFINIQYLQMRGLSFFCLNFLYPKVSRVFYKSCIGVDSPKLSLASGVVYMDLGRNVILVYVLSKIVSFHPNMHEWQCITIKTYNPCFKNLVNIQHFKME